MVPLMSNAAIFGIKRTDEINYFMVQDHIVTDIALFTSTVLLFETHVVYVFQIRFSLFDI